MRQAWADGIFYDDSIEKSFLLSEKERAKHDVLEQLTRLDFEELQNIVPELCEAINKEGDDK